MSFQTHSGPTCNSDHALSLPSPPLLPNTDVVFLPVFWQLYWTINKPHYKSYTGGVKRRPGGENWARLQPHAIVCLFFFFLQISLYPRSSLHAHAPAMWRPETRTWPLGAEQLHGWDRVVEEVAEAEHGTDEDTWRSAAVLRNRDREAEIKCLLTAVCWISSASSAQADGGEEEGRHSCDLGQREPFGRGYARSSHLPNREPQWLGSEKHDHKSVHVVGAQESKRCSVFLTNNKNKLVQRIEFLKYAFVA